jgi:hypothetical protein
MELRMVSKWRLHARAIINATYLKNAELPDDSLRKAISKAYPFGERKMYPYKIWLQEVNIFFKIKKLREHNKWIIANGVQE